jgi:hypothetical protein
VGQSTAGTLAELWNGTTWAIEPTPSPAGTAASVLNGVSCTSRSSCTAVGAAFTAYNGNFAGTLAERWNGQRWSIQPTPLSKRPGYGLGTVSCTSASACMAVGAFFDSSGNPLGLLAERWNGTSWKTEPVPLPAGVHRGLLSGVSCTSASACTAVGAAFNASGNGLGTIAERWNGHSWRVQPAPTSKRPGYFLAAVSCTSATTCTAAGNTASKLLAERWNGTAWSVQPTPTPPGTQGNGDFFNGVSCSSFSACTTVGLAFSPSGPFTVNERWNGSRWSIQPTPSLPGPYDIDNPAVSCPTSSVCTAVGGYTNNGVKLTLAERWQAGRASALVIRESGTLAPPRMWHSSLDPRVSSLGRGRNGRVFSGWRARL